MEYAAILDDSELCHEARLVYLVFRRHMDIATGVTGQRRVVDYNEIRQSLEYLPARGSRDTAKRYSRDQIKRYIQQLVERGLLERLHGSGLRQAMLFKLPLASNDSIRTDEERHQSATRGTPRGKLEVVQDLDSQSAIRAPREERHISDISDNSLSTPNAREQFPMYADWGVVGEDWLRADLLIKGFDVAALDDLERGRIVDEFIAYWMGRPDRQFDQAVWESKFSVSVAFAMRKGA